MIKKFLCSLAIVSMLIACKSETTDGSFQAVDAGQVPVPANASPTEQLRAVALEESNYLERVRQSFIPLQEEYKKANGKVPGVGDVNIFVDDFFTLMIENTHEGHVYQSKVNLKNLNNEQGGMMLVPDKASGEFPGLKIFVKEGQKGVEILKDGKLMKEEKRVLEIYLLDRIAIERVTPAIVQALNIANGKTGE